MDNENELTQIITDEDHGENEEIQEMEAGGHLNVIPFHLIKIGNSSQQAANRFTNVIKEKNSKYYKQTYRAAWEQMPDFKGWLKGVKGQPTRAYCIYCDKTLHAHRLSLLKHTCTIRHQKAAQLNGNPTRQQVNLNVSMDSNMQTVIVNEEGILTEEDDSNELMQSQIIYTTQEEIEDAEIDHDTENERDNDEDSEGEEIVSGATTDNSASKKIQFANVAPISTHVIDTTRGAPVSGLSVSLYKLVDGRWTYINEGLTDPGGRFNNFIKRSNFTPGRYKLHYDVDRYFEAKRQESVYPFIEVVFDSSTMTRHHFPLLLSPNSYTTYRSTHDD